MFTVLRRTFICGEHYRALGLQTGASLHEVKEAYTRCAKMYHPGGG